MMSSAILALALAAGAEPQLAGTRLSAVGVDEKLAAAASEHLATSLPGVRVVTDREVATLLGMERQKQLLGCSTESTSCIAELASALGVDGVLLGDLVRLDANDTFQVTLKVVGSSNGKLLSTRSLRARGAEQLFDALTTAGKELATEVRLALGLSAQTTTAPPRTRPTAVIFTLGGAGVAGLVAGGVLQGLAASSYASLQKDAFQTPDARRLAEVGRTQELGGNVALGVGGALLVAAGAVWLFSGGEVAVTPTASTGGAGVMVGGVLP